MRFTIELPFKEIIQSSPLWWWPFPMNTQSGLSSQELRLVETWFRNAGSLTVSLMEAYSEFKTSFEELPNTLMKLPHMAYDQTWSPAIDSTHAVDLLGERPMDIKALTDGAD